MLEKVSPLIGIFFLLVGLQCAFVTALNPQVLQQSLVIGFTLESAAIVLFAYGYRSDGWRRALICQPGVGLALLPRFFIVSRFLTYLRK
jgi:hypothetical protein